MNRQRRDFCLAALASACFIPTRSQAQGTLRKVTVALGHQAIGVGEELYMYAVPLQLGFFRDESLDVSFEPTSGSGAAVQLVVGGRADMGQSNPTTVFNAVQKGAKIRLVFNLTPRYASGLAVLEDSPIKSPKDLAGKIVGVVSLASGRLPEVKAMLSNVGLKADSDVRLVAVGVGAQAASALRSNQVQALYLWDTAYAVIESQGIKLRVMRDVFPGVEKMLDSLQFASEDFIQKDPEAIAGFGRAAAKGILWTIANPEAALDLFYKTYPDVRAKSDEARQSDLTVLKNIMPAEDFRTTATKKFGYFAPDGVDYSLQFMTDQGQVPPGIKPDQTYTNQFIDRANQFDPAAVVAAARAYKGR